MTAAGDGPLSMRSSRLMGENAPAGAFLSVGGGLAMAFVLEPTRRMKDTKPTKIAYKENGYALIIDWRLTVSLIDHNRTTLKPIVQAKKCDLDIQP
jgi:hypothetical protein